MAEAAGRTTLPRALVAFLALPGVFAFALPAWLVFGDASPRSGSWLGGVLLAAGASGLARCVRDFFVSGRGTLAPWDPPRQLVVVGLYRRTRNPMYLSVLTVVLGWALFAGSTRLLVYAGALALGFHLRVVLGEEPWLARQFGASWTAYRAAVPRWWVRRTSWRG